MTTTCHVLIMRQILIGLSSIAAVSCGGPDGPKGDPASTCTVTHDSGGTVIECSDGTTARLRGDVPVSIDDMVVRDCRTVDGSLLLENAADVRNANDVCRIAGDLDVQANGVTVISLPALESVEGNLQIIGLDDSAVFMPELASVSGVTSIIGNLSSSIVLPQLESIGGKLFISGNQGSSMSFPLLARVDQAAVISFNFAPSVFLPSLKSVGLELLIGDNGQLTDFSAPLLTSVGGPVFVARNRELRSLSFPFLLNARGEVRVVANDALETCTGQLIVRTEDCLE